MIDGNDVWIGLRDGRVCRYRRDIDTWETHPVFFKEHAMKWHRTRLAADSRYVWIPAQMEGLLRYDKVDDSWKRYTAADGLSSGIGFVIVDDDNVWAYGWDLCKYDRKTDSWTIIDDKRGLVQTNIRDLILGRDYMWILYWAWWENDENAPLVVAALSTIAALALFFTATVPAIREERYLNRVEVERQQLHTRIWQELDRAAAQQMALQIDIQSLLVELDRQGIYAGPIVDAPPDPTAAAGTLPRDPR